MVRPAARPRPLAERRLERTPGPPVGGHLAPAGDVDTRAPLVVAAVGRARRARRVGLHRARVTGWSFEGPAALGVDLLAELHPWVVVLDARVHVGHGFGLDFLALGLQLLAILQAGVVVLVLLR